MGTEGYCRVGGAEMRGRRARKAGGSPGEEKG
jgi:hypothetical protein